MNFEKLEKATGLLATLVIPVAVVLVANIYSKSMKERELEGKFVELAVDVLSDKPSPENRAVREWATKVINDYSGVPLGVTATMKLIEEVPITQKSSSSLSRENPALVNLLTILRLHLGNRNVSFAEMTDWSFAELGINPAEGPIAKIEAQKMAATLDKYLTSISSANYESGADRGAAIGKLESMLLDEGKNISDLADLVDELYRFPGE